MTCSQVAHRHLGNYLVQHFDVHCGPHTILNMYTAVKLWELCRSQTFDLDEGIVVSISTGSSRAKTTAPTSHIVPEKYRCFNMEKGFVELFYASVAYLLQNYKPDIYPKINHLMVRAKMYAEIVKYRNNEHPESVFDGIDDGEADTFPNHQTPDVYAIITP